MKFVKYITEHKIKKRILSISEEVNLRFNNKNPIILCVLNGAVYFAMDLVKYFNFNYRIDFIKIKSYNHMKRGEIVCNDFDFKSLINEDVVIVEDIIDSGKTIEFIIKKLENINIKSFTVITLLKKNNINKIKNKVIDWYGFNIKDKYVIGYGLDINNLFRDLKDIYIKDE